MARNRSNNIYVQDEGNAITGTVTTGLLADDRDANGDDIDITAVTDSEGVALVPEMVMGVPTGYLVNPTDGGTGQSLLTSVNESHLVESMMVESRMSSLFA